MMKTDAEIIAEHWLYTSGPRRAQCTDRCGWMAPRLCTDYNDAKLMFATHVAQALRTNRTITVTEDGILPSGMVLINPGDGATYLVDGIGWKYAAYGLIDRELICVWHPELDGAIP